MGGKRWDKTNFAISARTLFITLKFNVRPTMSYLRGKKEQTLDKPMAQLIPTARIPPSRAFVCLKKNCCKCLVVGPAHLYQSPCWGLWKRANT